MILKNYTKLPDTTQNRVKAYLYFFGICIPIALLGAANLLDLNIGIGLALVVLGIVAIAKSKFVFGLVGLSRSWLTLYTEKTAQFLGAALILVGLVFVEAPY